jgi:hypothetical protein
MFLTFSIFGVTFLKGTFYECNESMLTVDQMQLVTHPIPYGHLTSDQMTWLDPNTAGCRIGDWGSDYIPSSRELCICLSSEWEPSIAQNFDNVLRGFALLFEISTTEGWIDVMVRMLTFLRPPTWPQTHSYPFIVLPIFSMQQLINEVLTCSQLEAAMSSGQPTSSCS